MRFFKALLSWPSVEPEPIVVPRPSYQPLQIRFST